MIKKLLLILIAVSFIASCATSGPSSDPVTNIEKATSGDTLWRAKYSNTTIEIAEVFKFKGSQDKSDQKASRTYYVFDAGGGKFIYIVEVKIKGMWRFPADYDPVLGKNQKTDASGMLAYEPLNYSVWNDMAKRSHTVLTGMGVEVPKCNTFVEQAKLSPSRSSGVWVVMGEESSCDHTLTDVNNALGEYHINVELN